MIVANIICNSTTPRAILRVDMGWLKDLVHHGGSGDSRGRLRRLKAHLPSRLRQNPAISSHPLTGQEATLSRWKSGFESPWDDQRVMLPQQENCKRRLKCRQSGVWILKLVAKNQWSQSNLKQETLEINPTNYMLHQSSWPRRHPLKVEAQGSSPSWSTSEPWVGRDVANTTHFMGPQLIIGRALALQARGGRFESDWVHQEGRSYALIPDSQSEVLNVGCKLLR